jgi:hypothetical protein
MKKIGIGVAIATIAAAMSAGLVTPAFGADPVDPPTGGGGGGASNTITALTADKASVVSMETLTISATGTDWTGCVASQVPGQIAPYTFDAAGSISWQLGAKKLWNGRGTASGIQGNYFLALYSGACSTVTVGTTVAVFEVSVPVAPVNGTGALDITLYENYDSSTLEATPYTYPELDGRFDGSTSGWSEVTSNVENYCGPGITGLPAGVTVDATYSPGGGVAPLLKFSGTPAAGSKGTYTTCLDLYDGDTICDDSYWIATITVSDGAPPAPKLADTGADSKQMVVSGAVAASILMLGAVFVAAYRRRLAVTAQRSE